MNKLLKIKFVAAAVLALSFSSNSVIAGEQYVWTGFALSEIEAQIYAANAAPKPLVSLPICIHFPAGFGWMCVGTFKD